MEKKKLLKLIIIKDHQNKNNSLSKRSYTIAIPINYPVLSLILLHSTCQSPSSKCMCFHGMCFDKFY